MKMADNQINYIRQLDDDRLVERWRTIYNAAPPDCLKPWLKQLLIYQVQEHRFGGLGADVLDKLRDIETNPLLQPNPKGLDKDHTKLRQRGIHVDRVESVV